MNNTQKILIVDDEENVKIGGNEAGHDFSLASKRVKIKH